jgi:multiple sugar transport system substrate-binding protein
MTSRGARANPLEAAQGAGTATLATFFFTIILAAAFFLGGCSTRRHAPDNTITFWGLGHEGEVVSQLMPEFERRNPGIKVRVQQIPWTAAHEKLLTAYVGNSTPDIAQMGNTWIPEFAAIGAIDDLSGRVARSSIRQADYFPGIWATNLVDGVLYGVPWYVDTRVLFYRKDLLANAGVTRAPRTWSEWVETMEKVKERHQARFVMLLPTNEWEEPTILALAQRSAILRDHDRFGAFEQPPFQRAFSFYIELFRRGYAPKISNTQVGNIYQGFEQADFAMYITGPWNVGEFRTRLSKSMQGKWTTAPMPAPDGLAYPGASTAGGSSLVLFKGSPNSDAAWKLIEYLSAPEQQQRFFQLTRDLPAHRAAWKTPELESDQEMRAFFEQLERVEPLPRVPEWEQIATTIYEDADSAIRGQRTVPQALADLDRKADLILAKRRWVMDRKARR